MGKSHAICYDQQGAMKYHMVNAAKAVKSWGLKIAFFKFSPVLDTPTTLLLSLMRSSMTARARNSYHES